MGMFDDSIFGIDMNMDGKIDIEDDFLVELLLEDNDRLLYGDDDDDD